MAINAEQIRAGRAILKWTQAELADRASVNINSIKNIEAETTQARPRMLSTLQRVLETAGLEFLPRSGVREATDRIRVFEDGAGYQTFFYEILHAIEHENAESLVTGVDEALFEKNLPGWDDRNYTNRMNILTRERGERKVKAIICEGDTNEYGMDYADYRYVPKDIFPSVTCYVCGNKVGIIAWKERTKIVVIEDEDVADTFRLQFNLLWEKGTSLKQKHRKTREKWNDR